MNCERKKIKKKGVGQREGSESDVNSSKKCTEKRYRVKRELEVIYMFDKGVQINGEGK